MAVSKKGLKYNRFGLNKSHKKVGINYWRFFFCAKSKESGLESTFFIEYEMLNPWLSPVEPVLGFKPRIKISEDDLQYALAGTSSALGLESEKMVTPSYVALRIGKLDSSPKHLCEYIPLKNIKFNSKPFEIITGNNKISDNELCGEMLVSYEEHQKHPEYLCDQGIATWNLKYDIIKESVDGYENPTDKWFPIGMHAYFSGIVSFDGVEYEVEPKKSSGYIERFWGKSFPEKWFHLSSSTLSSLISGNTLFNSCFAIHGVFEDKISFLGDFEGTEFSFCPNTMKRTDSAVWNCLEAPELDQDEDKRLHWSVSLSSKIWVIDIDIYCKEKDLYNRILELPEGKRKVLNMVQTATGIGELKLYKRIKKDLEQIEFARITNVLCEFGHTEEADL